MEHCDNIRPYNYYFFILYIMTINKEIKNTIDDLKVWDTILDYEVTEIDNWDIFTLMDKKHTWLVKDSWELFDMLYENFITN